MDTFGSPGECHIDPVVDEHPRRRFVNRLSDAAQNLEQQCRIERAFADLDEIYAGARGAQNRCSNRFRTLAFWMIFVTLMLPVEVRIMSTYEVIGTLGWLDSYAGLTVPLMASATATFLFRQFYLTMPNELVEAAQLDGVGPLRFLWSFLLPLSWANIAALFVVLFIFGWNQYLWPLMITNTEAMRTVVIGLEQLIPRSGTELPTWNLMMAGAMMALLPPVAVIIFMQRWFVKGLVEAEK